MTFIQAVFLVIIVLVTQSALIFVLVVLAGKQMRKEKLLLQDQQMDQLYAKVIKLFIKFKRELPDYKEIMK